MRRAPPGWTVADCHGASAYTTDTVTVTLRDVPAVVLRMADDREVEAEPAHVLVRLSRADGEMPTHEDYHTTGRAFGFPAGTRWHADGNVLTARLSAAEVV